jgi:hypothetical protein
MLQDPARPGRLRARGAAPRVGAAVRLAQVRQLASFVDARRAKSGLAIALGLLCDRVDARLQ